MSKMAYQGVKKINKNYNSSIKHCKDYVKMISTIYPWGSET
jgi:hypothetical protein